MAQAPRKNPPYALGRACTGRGVLGQDAAILRQVPLRVCAKLNTQVIKIARPKADMAPSRMCRYRLSFDAGLMVLDTPHKAITDTALSGVGG